MKLWIYFEERGRDISVWETRPTKFQLDYNLGQHFSFPGYYQRDMFKNLKPGQLHYVNLTINRLKKK